MAIWDIIARVVSYPVAYPFETVFAVSLALVIGGLVYFFFKLNRDVFGTVDIIWVADGAFLLFIVVFTALVRAFVTSAVMFLFFVAAVAVEVAYLSRRGTATIAPRRGAKIGVMPFLLGVSSEEEWRLGYGLADMVSRALSAYKVSVMDPFRAAAGYVRRGVSSEAEAIAWGEALEIDYLISGRVRLVGANIQLRYKVAGLFEGREWRRPRILVPMDRPFEAVAALVEDLVTLFRLEVENEAALAYYRAPAAKVSAWNNYCEGRRLEISGSSEDLAKAREVLQEVWAADENYALAAVALVEVILRLARQSVHDEEKFLSFLEDAYRVALRAVRHRPELPETQNIMGEVFVFLSGGRDADLFRRAQTRFLEAVRLNPNSARSWYNLALISKYSVPEEDAGYADFLAKALSADPSYNTARLALGRYLSEHNDDEGARRHYQLALTYNPRNVSALNELGYFYLKRKDGVHAAEILERSKEVDEHNHTTRYYLGLAYYQQEELGRAEDELWAAVAFKPNETKYFRGLARVLEAQEKYVEALSVWEEVLKRVADEDEAQKVRGHIGRLAERVKESA